MNLEVSRVPVNPGVMAGRQSLGPQFLGLFQEGLEFDPLIAEHAGIGRAPPKIFIYEVADDLLFEYFLQRDHVVGNSDLLGYPAGIRDVGGDKARTGLFRVIRRGIPEAHREADDLVAFFFQKSGGGGTVHPPAHGNGDFHFFKFSPQRAQRTQRKNKFLGWKTEVFLC